MAVRTPLVRRGHFRIEPLMIRTGDPFGFFEASAGVGQGVTLVVYPRVDAAADVAPATGQRRGRPRHPGADPADDAARVDRAAVCPGRLDEPDPLADHRAPGRDPGQGVRPRANRRCVAVPRPRRGHRGRRGRALDDGGRRPGGRLDRRQGARREPSGRHVHERAPADGPARRPRRAPAAEDPPAARGGRSRRPDAARRGPRDGRQPPATGDDGDRDHRDDRTRRSCGRSRPSARAGSARWWCCSIRPRSRHPPTRRPPRPLASAAAPCATRSRSSRCRSRRSAPIRSWRRHWRDDRPADAPPRGRLADAGARRG